MHTPSKRFLPAAGSDRLLPLYDPFCRLFRADRLREQIASQDDPRLAPFTHTDERDCIQTGRVTVHTGGRRDSHLLLPRIPPRA